MLLCKWITVSKGTHALYFYFLLVATFLVVAVCLEIIQLYLLVVSSFQRMFALLLL